MSYQTDHNYPNRFKVANNISFPFPSITQYTHSFYYRAWHGIRYRFYYKIPIVYAFLEKD